jgi:hypothetical protein
LLEARENTNVHARSESSGEKKQRAADHALLAKGFDLADEYFFVESWFEVGDKVDAVLTGNRAARAKREALIIEKVLEPRREWWTQAAAWPGGRRSKRCARITRHRHLGQQPAGQDS